MNKALDAGFGKIVGTLKAAAGIPAAAEKLFAGLVGSPVKFVYNNVKYQVFATADQTGVKVKVATDEAKPTLVVVLDATQLAGQPDLVGIRTQVENLVKQVQSDLAAKDGSGKPKPNITQAKLDSDSVQTQLIGLANGLAQNGCAEQSNRSWAGRSSTPSRRASRTPTSRNDWSRRCSNGRRSCWT